MKVQSGIPDDLPNEITDRYGIVNNTFVGLDKGEKHSELEVEIGDIHSDAFEPQFKLKRWENECNFSVRLIDDDANIPKIETKGNKIKFIKEKTEAHFYDVPKKGEMPECFEFEVILKEKPNINKVQMSIETKELAFYYQPELTQEEIDDGCIRPENVVGSYAVYHESKANDYSKIGLKNYRAGKAFHIYRPKMIDNAGKEIWGELNIDVENNLLTVEIPQEFLDNAVYPVRHAAGLTFGFTSTGSSDLTIAMESGGTRYSYTRGSTYNLSGAGTLDKITASLKMRNNNDTVDVSLALYREDSAGSGSHDKVVLIETLELSLTTSYQVFDFTAASEELTADDYILSAIGNAADIANANDRIHGAYDTGGAERNVYLEWSDEAGGGYATRKAEDPWTEVASISTDRYSIYCTYTEAAVGGARPSRVFLGPFAGPLGGPIQ